MNDENIRAGARVTMDFAFVVGDSIEAKGSIEHQFNRHVRYGLFSGIKQAYGEGQLNSLSKPAATRQVLVFDGGREGKNGSLGGARRGLLDKLNRAGDRVDGPRSPTRMSC